MRCAHIRSPKARFTICRIVPSHRAVSRPSAKIEVDSILVTRQRDTFIVNLALGSLHCSGV